MSRFRKAGGFTMVELLVALAVFATVMAGISVVFVSSLRAWRTGQESRSVFQMARAAKQFMERDITSAFGSVDRDEVKTLVGTRDWLTFVGITENPLTLVVLSSGVTYDVPHSDVSRISYYLAPDPTGSENFLLIRLVSIDKDGLVDLEPDPRNALGDDRQYFAALSNAGEFSGLAAGAPVIESDFELASNILDMEFRYGVLTGDVELTGIWAEWNYVSIDARLTEEERQARLGRLWEETIVWSPGWDSRDRPDRKLPDVIEVRLSVRAAARMPTPDTMVREFRTTIFLPLGYRRPMPAALQ